MEIYFPHKTFVSYNCYQRNFFSRIYRDGIENIFHNIWRIFRIAKLKYSNSNFWTDVYYVLTNNTHIICTFRYSTLCELTHLVYVGGTDARVFLMLTSDIIISNIASIVVNLEYFKNSPSPCSVFHWNNFIDNVKHHKWWCSKRISWDWQ